MCAVGSHRPDTTIALVHFFLYTIHDQLRRSTDLWGRVFSWLCERRSARGRFGFRRGASPLEFDVVLFFSICRAWSDHPVELIEHGKKTSRLALPFVPFHSPTNMQGKRLVQGQGRGQETGERHMQAGLSEGQRDRD